MDKDFKLLKDLAVINNSITFLHSLSEPDVVRRRDEIAFFDRI